nr:water-soluble peptide [Papaver somniferum]
QAPQLINQGTVGNSKN